MSSPVFDSGAARAFAQKALNSLLLGISFQDERHYSLRAHVLASVLNVVIGLVYIAVSFVPYIYARIAVGLALPLLYFCLSFLTRERQAERLRDKLSLGAEFANAFMYEFAVWPVKLLNLLMNAVVYILFAFAVYNGMHCSCGVFLALALIHSLRGIDSTMNKSMPVNDFEPALSLLVYSVTAFGASFVVPWMAYAIFTAYPFLSFTGLFPQTIVLLQWVGEKICELAGVYLVQPASFYTAASLVIVAVMHPSTLCLFALGISLASAGFSRNPAVKMIILGVVSVCGITYSIICNLRWKIFTGVRIPFMELIFKFRYTSLCIGALSIIFAPLVFLLRAENMRPRRRSFNMAINCVLSVFGVFLTVFHLLEYLQYLHAAPLSLTKSFSLIMSSRVAYCLFYPFESICGLLLGSWIHFVVDVPCYVAEAIGVVLFNAISRFAQLLVYQKHQCEICFKTPLKGWQLRLYNIRWLAYTWNCIIFAICSLCDIPALPIGGIPVYIPFHPHPMSYFTLKSTYKLAGRTDALTSVDDENKDDIAIYNLVVRHLFAGKSELHSEMREFNFCEGYLPPGSIQLLMSEKKMLFLMNTGSNLLRTSYNYLVYALETVETSCHTLERTCLERYVDFLDTQKTEIENYVHDVEGPTLIPVSYVDTGRLTPMKESQSKRTPLTLNINRNRGENHLPANVPLFNNSWLCKYKGVIDSTDVTENEYSLAGMFVEQYYREELVRVFIALLYQTMSGEDVQAQTILSEYGAEHCDAFAQQAEFVTSILTEIFSIDINLKKQQAIVGLSIYTNFAYTKLESDTVIAKLYKSVPRVMKSNFLPNFQKEAENIVLQAFRSACYYSIQQIMMGDGFATAPTEFSQILNDQASVLLSHPTEAQWASEMKEMTCDKMFAIIEGPRAVEETVQTQKWALFNLPHFYYKSIWSSTETDLLVFNSTDDERFSVESLPAALRNLFCEAAGSPFGYPLVEYGQGMI